MYKALQELIGIIWFVVKIPYNIIRGCLDILLTSEINGLVDVIGVILLVTIILFNIYIYIWPIIHCIYILYKDRAQFKKDQKLARRLLAEDENDEYLEQLYSNLLNKNNLDNRNHNDSKALGIKEAGELGETLVTNELLKIDGVAIERSVYLPLNRQLTSYTEIDIIAYTKARIYIIEVKNYSGEIIGREDDANWIKVSRNKIQDIRNPILQNQTHVKAFVHEFPDYAKYVKSLVVFCDDADISRARINNKSGSVININEVRGFITADSYNCNNPMSQEQFLGLKEGLKTCMESVTDDIKQQHISNIQAKYGES